jgi:hypothetical protein
MAALYLITKFKVKFKILLVNKKANTGILSKICKEYILCLLEDNQLKNKGNFLSDTLNRKIDD